MVIYLKKHVRKSPTKLSLNQKLMQVGLHLKRGCARGCAIYFSWIQRTKTHDIRARAGRDNNLQDVHAKLLGRGARHTHRARHIHPLGRELHQFLDLFGEVAAVVAEGRRETRFLLLLIVGDAVGLSVSGLAVKEKRLGMRGSGCDTEGTYTVK